MSTGWWSSNMSSCGQMSRCKVIGDLRFCEDSCEGYTRCQNYEECYLRQVRYCSASNCVVGAGATCRLRATKPGRCPVIQAIRCYTYVSQCYRDNQCSGSSKCCHDGCRFQCTPVYDANNPCSSVVCLSHQVCNISNKNAYCLDTCRNNGPCASSRVCRLVDQNCNGTLPCPKRARCEKPACVGDTHTYRTNRLSFSISYPGRITSTTCGRFNGSVVIIATNGQCINVTADVRYPNPKAGETIKVYDGQAPSKRLRFQGQSLRNIYFVSSGPTMTIDFTTPDISASIGMYLLFRLQSTCHIAYTVDRSEEDTTPDPVITTEPVTTTRIITTPVLTTEPVTTEQIITNPVITTEPGTITKSQTVVSTSESSSTNMCPDDCPTPRIGCTLIKANEDDCCGKESCFVVNP
ncbi:uncharacterized protein LOC134179014 isoform X2 [Corticium candelabrum]|uniref:uncharacterized protein LOC134179014 isoform X2 n=1 Tax=Corticium candelabrum TaxID=121492 RepID=UPI002E2720A3|nr:uncharacterized protein LOC134179014 isoform X2 [Corticium candelabrum]